VEEEEEEEEEEAEAEVGNRAERTSGGRERMASRTVAS
jgi:hypothetical protein